MFTLPLFVDSPTRRPAFLTWRIIIACTVTFLWQTGLWQTGLSRSDPGASG
jgi:hypothetical protein